MIPSVYFWNYMHRGTTLEIAPHDVVYLEIVKIEKRKIYLLPYSDRVDVYEPAGAQAH